MDSKEENALTDELTRKAYFENAGEEGHRINKEE
jgi:hypothetical protein